MDNSTIDRTKPPISKELPEIQFPAFEKIELDNGIRIYKIEDYTQPLLTVKTLFNSGALDEDIPGAAYFTSKMMVRGTEKRTNAEIAEQIENLGAGMNASAKKDDTVMSLTVLRDNADEALDIYFDCMLNSIFDETEIERFRQKHIADIQESLSDSGCLAKIAFNKGFYGDHPYASPLQGTVDSNRSIMRDHLLAQYNKLFTENKPAFIIAGNGDFDSIIKKIEENSDKFTGGSEDQSIRKIRPIEAGNRVVLIEKPDSVQTTLRLGKFTIGRSDPGFPALQIANTILGGYFQSRLNELLREKRGFTYGVHSMINTRKAASNLVIGSDISQENTNQAMKDTLDELEKISKYTISDEELNTAKQYMTGSFARKLETPKQISTFVQSLVVFDLPENYYKNFFEKIHDAKKDELLEVQKDNLSPDSLLIAASGNIENLKEAMKDFGEISICGVNGNIEPAK